MRDIFKTYVRRGDGKTYIAYHGSNITYARKTASDLFRSGEVQAARIVKNTRRNRHRGAHQ